MTNFSKIVQKNRVMVSILLIFILTLSIMGCGGTENNQSNLDPDKIVESTDGHKPTTVALINILNENPDVKTLLEKSIEEA